MSSIFQKSKNDQICNICRKTRKLSEDHIPPKGTLIKKNFWIDNFGRIFLKSENKPRLKFSQSGIRFETICASCNNKLSKYDRKLIRFASDIQSLIINRENIKSLTKISVNIFPNAIMRSVLGHLLAAKTETDNVVPDNKIRSFILNDSLPVHEDIHILYWFYPYSNIRISRDFTMSSKRGTFSNFGFYSVIKFFPIAFLISDLPFYEGLPSLDEYKNLSVNHQSKIELSIFPMKEEDWPESVTEDNHFVAGGRSFMDSLIAKPK